LFDAISSFFFAKFQTFLRFYVFLSPRSNRRYDNTAIFFMPFSRPQVNSRFKAIFA